MTGRSKAGTAPAPITFVNVPLEADAYYVNVDLSREERLRLQKAWQDMNAHLDKPKVLMILPASLTLKQMPSEVLRQWIEKCATLLRERGDELPKV